MTTDYYAVLDDGIPRFLFRTFRRPGVDNQHQQHGGDDDRHTDEQDDGTVRERPTSHE